VALNVAMDLEPFSRINPCGYAGLPTVDLSTIGVSITWDEAAGVLTTAHLNAGAVKTHEQLRNRATTTPSTPYNPTAKQKAAAKLSRIPGQGGAG
jgi:lipoate-protein ligase B